MGVAYSSLALPPGRPEPALMVQAPMRRFRAGLRATISGRRIAPVARLRQPSPEPRRSW